MLETKLRCSSFLREKMNCNLINIDLLLQVLLKIFIFFRKLNFDEVAETDRDPSFFFFLFFYLLRKKL